MPPSVSPFSRAASMAATIRVDASSSAQRTGERSTASQSTSPSGTGTCTSPIRTTQEWTSTPMRGEQRPRHRAGRDPRGGLASAGPLEHVARVVEAVLEDAREVRVPGTNARHPFGLESPRLDLHRTLPVLPVAVLDHQRDRRPERLAAADAADDPGRVVLDLLALSPTVAALAAPKVGVDVARGVQRQPAGTPSTITVSCGPCDSPAVRNRSICNGLYWRGGRVPHSRARIAPRFVRAGSRFRTQDCSGEQTRPAFGGARSSTCAIARLLDAHGDVIGAICAYREVIARAARGRGVRGAAVASLRWPGAPDRRAGRLRAPPGGGGAPVDGGAFMVVSSSL